jgi:hypothetical protein
VLRRDARLRVITRQRLAASGSHEVIEPALDELAIPTRAILLFEEQEASHSIHASVEPRRVKAHERNERVRLRSAPAGSSLSMSANRSASSQSSRRITRSGCAEL